jgi:hypothetical protein
VIASDQPNRIGGCMPNSPSDQNGTRYDFRLGWSDAITRLPSVGSTMNRAIHTLKIRLTRCSPTVE